MSEYDVKYDSKRRFVSYWHQIREILNLQPQRVLEVGVGNGFVSNYLRERGVELTTVDYEATLKPDVVADVRKLPFEDNTFDVVAAYEILEHLPYEESLKGLAELQRVSKQHILVSLPDATRSARIEFPVPGWKKFQLLISAPVFPRQHQLTKSGHHWEIGKKGYPLSQVVHDIQQKGLQLVKTYRVYENPQHRFFVLRKNG